MIDGHKFDTSSMICDISISTSSMSAENCHVRSKSDRALYIHFDPKSTGYLVHDSTIGACVFTTTMARDFIQRGLQDPMHKAWEIEILPGNMTKVSKDTQESQKFIEQMQKQYDEYSQNR